MSAARTHRVAVLAGDGVGPEVVDAGLRVLAEVADRFGFGVETTEHLIGGAAIDATGSPLPDGVLEACRDADAVLLGAVGGPRWDDPAAPVRPEQGLLGLRKGLGLYANLRPVSVNPKLLAASPLRPELLAGVDLLVVRELTGGIDAMGEASVRVRSGERIFSGHGADTDIIVASAKAYCAALNKVAAEQPAVSGPAGSGV